MGTALLVGSVVAAIAVSLFVVARRPPDRVAPPTRIEPTAEVTSMPAGASVFVHVAGFVAVPGLYEVPAGSRVADAIEAAGGPTRRADLDGLNLAEVVRDGMKIDVPRRVRSMGAVIPSPTVTTPSPISLNSADQAALETVPGIGPVRAAAIIAFRDQNGGFTAVEELLEVQGIGPTILASIRELVTL